MSIKTMIKKVMKQDASPIVYGSESREKYSKALKDLVDHYPDLDKEKIIITKEKMIY